MPSGIAHGGRLIEARKRFPRAPAPFIDLSTGINPNAYPVGPLDPAGFARLPEPEQLEALHHAAARAYGVDDPAMVVAAPGTQILISLLPRLLGLGHATILGPTYAEHAAAWSAACLPVSVRENVAAFRDTALRAGGAAILCNPNNPDGRVCEPAMLLGLADELAGSGAILICDEAFADLEPGNRSLAGTLPHPGLLILRSFGKSYGLAGLRLGFLLASHHLAQRIRIALGPWAVAGPALAIGPAALGDAAWRERQKHDLQLACDRLDRLVTQVALAQAGGTRLFRLYRGADASSWFERLGQAGILVRRFTEDSELLRFGLPGRETEWHRLEAALGEK